MVPSLLGGTNLADRTWTKLVLQHAIDMKLVVISIILRQERTSGAVTAV